VLRDWSTAERRTLRGIWWQPVFHGVHHRILQEPLARHLPWKAPCPSCLDSTTSNSTYLDTAMFLMLSTVCSVRDSERSPVLSRGPGLGLGFESSFAWPHLINSLFHDDDNDTGPQAAQAPAAKTYGMLQLYYFGLNDFNGSRFLPLNPFPACAFFLCRACNLAFRIRFSPSFRYPMNPKSLVPFPPPGNK